MNWTIPGTVLQVPVEEAQYVPEQLRSMFLGGGMVLSQVAGVTGLEPYTIQNWVKRGLLAPPVAKRYSLRQLCRILNINMLRGVLPLDRTCRLLGYVNGRLDDEGDDIIDDAQLYFMFVRLAVNVRGLYDSQERQRILDATLETYDEPYPGARDRVRNALQVMLTAWLAARMQQEAERRLGELLEESAIL